MKLLFFISPFLFFMSGYLIISRLISTSVVIVPSIISHSLQEALVMVSDKDLSVRIIAQKDDSEKEPGTIIYQYPLAQQSVRRLSSIDVIIVKKPEVKVVPKIVGKRIHELQAQDGSFSYTIHEIEHSYPSDYIIAQFPQPGTIFPEAASNYTVHVYKPFHKAWKFMPSLVGCSVQSACETCRLHGFEPILLYDDTKKNIYENVVIEQRPQAGALVDVSKPLTIQLKIS